MPISVAPSCATQIFLANPGMNPQVYRETFHLNDAETAWIARLVPRRQFLIKQAGRSKVVSLNVESQSADDRSARGLEIPTRSHSA